jgi:hypothetical protein
LVTSARYTARAAVSSAASNPNGILTETRLDLS